MNKKAVLISLLVIIIICAAVFFVTKGKKGTEVKKDYIISDNKSITYQATKTVPDFTSNKEISKTVFSETGANNEIKIGPDTLKYFKFLLNQFPECKDEACNIEKVRQYLFNNFSKKQAEDLFHTYQLFLDCENKVSESQKNQPQVSSIEDIINRLDDTQDLRRKVLGDKLADALYGPEVKAQEYSLRKTMVVEDKNMYGAQKEAAMKQLNKDMWGGSNDNEYDSLPHIKYQEQLSMYQKDLADARDNDSKNAIIKQQREKCFDKETVGMLEKNDVALNSMQEQKKTYENDKQQIMDDPKLDDQRKEQMLIDLQKNTFGAEQAEKIQRMERLDKGLQELKDKTPQKTKDKDN